MTDVKSTTTVPTPEKGMAAKAGDSMKAAGKTVSDKSKVAANKVSEGAKSASASVKSGARKTGDAVKANPGKTAAAVGGVAAAAAAAVVGTKMFRDKQKKDAARAEIDKVGMPEMRSGGTKVDRKKS